jgi:hypothetical protein
MNNTDTIAPQSAADEEASWPIPVLKENLHYYMENGFMVFTETYHNARGRCCGNACRHCPFEHVNVRAR